MSELIFDIKQISIEVLVISLIVFALTMLIKWPIKKVTSKLNEDKRKAVNTLIIFIPIILSFLLTLLYSGIFKSEWFSLKVVETSISSWVMAFSIYAIYQRIVIIIKGLISGNIKIGDKVVKETISLIKSDINSLKENLKKDQKELNKVLDEKSILIKLKNELENTIEYSDLSKLSETNIEINSLTQNENKLRQQIENAQLQISNCEKELQIKKGETYGQ